MTDKELLEAAAKAIGLDGMWDRYAKEFVPKEGPIFWNPITSLADRYELARKCRLEIDFDFGSVSNPRYSDDVFNFTFGDDRSEAIAILQAAIASKGD